LLRQFPQQVRSSRFPSHILSFRSKYICYYIDRHQTPRIPLITNRIVKPTNINGGASNSLENVSPLILLSAIDANAIPPPRRKANIQYHMNRHILRQTAMRGKFQKNGAMIGTMGKRVGATTASVLAKKLMVACYHNQQSNCHGRRDILANKACQHRNRACLTATPMSNPIPHSTVIIFQGTTLVVISFRSPNFRKCAITAPTNRKKSHVRLGSQE